MAEPIRVVITGAAGQIGYSLVYMIASGSVFGADQVREKKVVTKVDSAGNALHYFSPSFSIFWILLQHLELSRGLSWSWKIVPLKLSKESSLQPTLWKHLG